MDPRQCGTVPQPAGRTVRNRARDCRPGTRLACQGGVSGGRARRRHGSHTCKPLARISIPRLIPPTISPCISPCYWLPLLVNLPSRHKVSRVQVGVSVLELLLDLGTGLAGHLPPDPLPVRVEAERDHPAPAARTRPVVRTVATVTPVVEVDAVLAVATAPSPSQARKSTTWLPTWLPKRGQTSLRRRYDTASDLQ